MAAEKQKRGGSRFSRFRERPADTHGSTALNYTRGRAFGPFVRLGQPANDNRMPASLLFLRALVLLALLAIAASVVL